MSHPVLVPGTIFTEEEYARFITGNMEMKELDSIQAEGRPVPSPPSDFQFQLKPYPPLNGPPKVPTSRFLTGTADEEAKEEAIDAEMNKHFNKVIPLAKEFKRAKEKFITLVQWWNDTQNYEKKEFEMYGKYYKKYDIQSILALPDDDFQQLEIIWQLIENTMFLSCCWKTHYPMMVTVLKAKIEVLNAMYQMANNAIRLEDLLRNA